MSTAIEGWIKAWNRPKELYQLQYLLTSQWFISSPAFRCVLFSYIYTHSGKKYIWDRTTAIQSIRRYFDWSLQTSHAKFHEKGTGSTIIVTKSYDRIIRWDVQIKYIKVRQANAVSLIPRRFAYKSLIIKSRIDSMPHRFCASEMNQIL